MKSIIQPMDMPYTMLAGVANTHDHLIHIEDTGIIVNRLFDGKTIPVICGGGSGHEPAHFGYVGQGMLAASISGNLFVPPTSDDILLAIEQLNHGLGVFVIIKNFEADLAVFQTAIKKARNNHIDVKYVVVHDDISIDTTSFHKRHRGVAGTILMHKILGQAALEGATLSELEQLALTVASNMYTLGVALNSVTFPNRPDLSFDLEEGCISFGIGIHGEPGYRTESFTTSERLAVELVNKLKLAIADFSQNKYMLLVNGLGATPLMDLYVFQSEVQELFALEGMDICFVKVGNMMTSYNMAGISVTLCVIQDEKWLDYLRADTNAFAW